jgi:hypothetical protein
MEVHFHCYDHQRKKIFYRKEKFLDIISHRSTECDVGLRGRLPKGYCMSLFLLEKVDLCHVWDWKMKVFGQSRCNVFL